MHVVVGLGGFYYRLGDLKGFLESSQVSERLLISIADDNSVLLDCPFGHIVQINEVCLRGSGSSLGVSTRVSQPMI